MINSAEYEVAHKFAKWFKIRDEAAGNVEMYERWSENDRKIIRQYGKKKDEHYYRTKFNLEKNLNGIERNRIRLKNAEFEIKELRKIWTFTPRDEE